MRVVDGYGIQADALYALKDKGIEKIIIIENGSGLNWHSLVSDWQMFGKLADYGNGKQWFLSMKYMKQRKEV